MEFLMTMPSAGWLTLGVIAALFWVLFRNWAPPDFAFLAASGILALCGIIQPNEALAGFSNSGMLTVAALFIVAAALRETGVLDYVGTHILGKVRTELRALLRLSIVVIPMSAFLNNTPVVAMFMPVVVDWSRRNQVAPSRLLIPLSYLAILGGTCTLIGTSTTLVLQGLILESGLPGLSLFEIGWVGIPYALIGVAYLAVARGLLPIRKEFMEQLGESRREYLVEMQVQPGCRLIGQTVTAAGLRQLPGLFLIEIDRQGEIIGPVSPDDRIEANDRLVFTGIVSSIIELEKTAGLVPIADPDYVVAPRQQRGRRLCEAVISQNSPLVGKTIREADFRATYGAAVVAMHRGGQRVTEKLGDVSLCAADTLLLQVQPHFLRAHRNDPAFYLVSDVDDYRPLRTDRAWVAVGLFLVLLAVMTLELVPTVIAATLCAIAMIGLDCISSGDARRSIELQVLVTIGASFGIGTALKNSGAALALAEGIVALTHDWGPIAAVAIIYLLGSVLTELITNNAVAVLLFPFCLETARLYDVDSRPFLIALALSASASFMTPIGYQTNMMVYGPGGYRFTDFMRIGTPLNIILGTVAIILIPLFWSF